MSIRRLVRVMAIGSLASAGIAGAGEQDFVLLNRTGVEIHALYVSPSDKDDWGKDILGEDTLPNGQEGEIEFSPKVDAALWDLRIEDSDGNSIEWKKLNLPEIAKITLLFDKATKKATAKIEKAEDEDSDRAPTDAMEPADLDFVLINKTGVEIHALYVSPSEKDAWGKDILGRDTLPDGAQGTVSFSPTERAEHWDLRIEDEDGDAIEWTDLDLNEISKLTLLYNKKSGKATAKVE